MRRRTGHIAWWAWVVLLGVFSGCGTAQRPDHSDVPSAAPMLGKQPSMTFTIGPDRILVVTPTSARSCLYPVQVVYAVNPRVLQAYLTGDLVDDCTPESENSARGSRSPIGKPVRFRIPESVDLDHVAFIYVVGPLSFYPRYRVDNALATPPA